MPRQVKDIVAALLFAVVTAVSAVALVRTATSPFGDGSFGLAQWTLFVVTVVGSACALLRSLRSMRALLKPRSTDTAETAEPAEAARPRTRMHPVFDDLTWAIIAFAVLAINVLALWAVVITLGELFGDSPRAVGWLIWQLVLLTAASVGLARLSSAVAGELRDRARRRRRNVVHVVTGKLMNWPGEGGSAGRRSREVAAVTATAILALVSLASASGPLLEPDRERAQLLADQAGRGEGMEAPVAESRGPSAETATAEGTANGPVAGSASAERQGGPARQRSRGRVGRGQQPDEPVGAEQIVIPETPPEAPPSAPAPVVPQPTPQADQRAGRPRRRAGDRRRSNERRGRSRDQRRQRGEGRQPKEATPPSDTAPAPPAPTLPAPAPPAPPCDPLEYPVGQPPCDDGYVGPLPE